jgi:hypothetical protein
MRGGHRQLDVEAVAGWKSTIIATLTVIAALLQ